MQTVPQSHVRMVVCGEFSNFPMKQIIVMLLCSYALQLCVYEQQMDNANDKSDYDVLQRQLEVPQVRNIELISH